MSTTVIIAVARSRGRRRNVRVEDATIVSEFFAITPTLHCTTTDAATVFASRRWTITHRPSGNAIASNIGRKSDAVVLAREFEIQANKHQVDLSIRDRKAITRSGAFDRLSLWWVTRRRPFIKTGLTQPKRAS